MTPEDIEKLVDEEIARRQIGAAYVRKPSFWAGFLKHPLFLTIFAFLATTILGGFYDSVLELRAEKRERLQQLQLRQARRATSAIEGLKEFTQLVNEREVGGRLLQSALYRGDAFEASERKKAYDKAFFRWNRDYYLNNLKLRDFVGGTHFPTEYEYAVRRSILQAFARVDGCLTAAYDLWQNSSLEAHFLSPTGPYLVPACRGLHWWTRLNKNNRIIRECSKAILRTMIPHIEQLQRTTPIDELDKPRANVAFQPYALDSYSMDDPGWDRDIYSSLQPNCAGMPTWEELKQ